MILGLRWIGSLFDWSRFVCTMIPLFSPLLRPRKHALHSGPVHQYFGVTYSNNRGLGRMITPCRPSKWFEVRDYNDKTAKMTPKAVIKTQNLTPKIPAVQHTLISAHTLWNFHLIQFQAGKNLVFVREVVLFVFQFLPLSLLPLRIGKDGCKRQVEPRQEVGEWWINFLHRCR